MQLRDTIAVVTGASRGVGRGIAEVLGENGATVYVTGRSSRATGSPTGRPETIEETAERVTARGGTGIPVRCDHTELDQIRALFDRVRSESGRLDVLVSNAWGGYEVGDGAIVAQPLWEGDPRQLDLMLTAGLRAHLLTAQFGLPLLTETGGGLLAVTTWAVGPEYYGQLYYDVAKTAVNRMPLGLAEDLRPSGGTAVAVSPGWTQTEGMPDEVQPYTESPEFIGRAVAALAADPDRGRHTGTLRTVVELAADYGFTDVNGRASSPFWDALAEGRSLPEEMFGNTAS
ncbi:NAD(P)-dependent dehydrogenase (short-subunit alcohol dehydrogenase family) [Actinoalloteichus hoggarensis]|uniref:Enoyl-[acyl-carrier-protein] reductase [NADPH] FabL n=1 Tax=Actinoalloteichus hoggarensis TaxID=1470176 RepID=A0A221W822_9PSEU|nr:SDR family NAD(P)-dependent oxidoreductase [Actinoalloteichus hoggarensis]ASO21487.1 Enoyl-[acyl-carrier-protein] reductase [NADPH] FabL [Actinoalloteichus hoggarensis]MBB5922076.1 NAD(P)-dependent dehydrogenase (short-subunit alcohol dehydrogenase family) [Actinoalloteichus hoggarensis]